jgi:hypothetical protein
MHFIVMFAFWMNSAWFYYEIIGFFGNLIHIYHEQAHKDMVF